MFTRYSTGESREDVFTEDEKLSEDYLIAEIDSTIAAMSSVSKISVQEAYKARNGERDLADFEYLWVAYGIEFPAKLRHVPVLRVIFDSIIGQYQKRPFKWQVTASDNDSVNAMFDQYRDAIWNDVNQYFINRIRAHSIGADMGGPEGEKAAVHLQKLKEKYEAGDFQSDLEIDTKHFMTWAIQKFEIQQKLEEMVNHFATSGEAYYQVKPFQKGRAPIIRALNPLGLYYHKGVNQRWINECDRIVYRERMTVVQIWNKFGHLMSKDQQEKFVRDYGKYVLTEDLEIVAATNAIVEKTDYATGNSSITSHELNVDYVEWKANIRVEMTDTEGEEWLESKPFDQIKEQKKRYKYRLDLFEGIRIGDCFHVAMGRNNFVVRDPDNPSDVKLTINGTCYNDINGKPYALALKVKDLNDQIDILHYHAEAFMAMSGTRAVMVDYASIPAWIGGNETQRVMKWLGFLKQGVGLIDTSQDGNDGRFQQGGSSMDMTLSNTIELIYRIAERLEETAYRITGTNRQTLGNISQGDGKGTTELAIQGSTTAMQSFFSLFDHLAVKFLTDVANASRMCYGEGMVGNILLGEAGQKLFSLKSKQFALAYLNVFLSNDGDVERDLDAVRATAQELIAAGMIDAKLAIDIVTIKSLTEIKRKVNAALASNDQQQKAEAQQQLEQLQMELKKCQQALDQASQQNSQVEMQKVKAEVGIKQQEADRKERELDNTVTTDAEELRIKNKQLDLEAMQIQYKPSAKEVKNV